MNLNQQFDEHIKEQFSNYAPDVHPRIWENIIAEKERRRPVGFWVNLWTNKNRLMFAALLIVTATAGTWFYTDRNTGAVDTKAVSEIKPAGKSDSQPVTDKNNDAKADQPGSVTTDQQSGQITSQGSQPGSTGDDSGNISGFLQNTGINSSSPGSSRMNISSPSLTGDNDVQKTNGSKNRSSKKYTGNGNELTINTEAPGLDNDQPAGLGTLLGRLNFEADKAAAAKKKKGNQFLTFKLISYFPDCPSFEKNASGNKKYFEVYGGLDYAFRSMSDTGNSVYLEKRKESEKFRSAFSAGVRYTRVFNNSMSVRTGVNYSQINEKFTYTQGNLVQVTYIIDANGDTTGTYLTTGTRYKTTINKYRSIDIPLTVGYEVGNGKLHANINAGVVVNVYSWQKGEVLDRSLNPTTITTGKGSSPYQFKTNAGVGFIGAVSVYYKLNDRLHVMAEPYFRYNVSPMTKESTTLKQKYHTAGLRLGLRLDLK